MNNIDLFRPFVKRSTQRKITGAYIGAVKYTRVSSKEQRDNNCSLDFQDKYIMDFAAKVNMPVLASFGGTFESAKTDGRKEFNRMLEFVRKNKGKVSHILVYSTSRFSRTGGEAIKIADDLRNKHGVILFPVTQPIDVTNEGGVLQQNIQLLFSHYDNVMRKQACHDGIRDRLQEGYWARMAPLGYEYVSERGNGKVLRINNKGKLIRLAFKWKAEGMKSEAILEKLKARGLPLYKQKLSYIFANPFYCGLITDEMLEGKMVQGKHEPLVSKEIFLQVNKIRSLANKAGTHHQSENEHIPLKLVAKCPKCGKGYTGYVVKAKNLYYYKCPTKGCCVSISAKQLNSDFRAYLERYCLKPELVTPLLAAMKDMFVRLNRESLEAEQAVQARLEDLDKRIERLEEKYFVAGEMEQEQFQKWHGKLTAERQEIVSQMGQNVSVSSNLEILLENAVNISMKLPVVWSSASPVNKEKIQNMIFPKGFTYNKENGAVLTSEVNLVFKLIADVQGSSGDNEKGQGGFYTTLSNHVGKTGFEPAAPWSQTRCATGLRHFPHCY